MVKNYSAITTLIRNKLNRENFGDFFYNKGIDVKTIDDDLFSLVNDKESPDTELSEVCEKGVIYRGPELVCYRGPKVTSMTLEEAKADETIVWNEKTVFAERIEGERIYMYWDPAKDDWMYADEHEAVNNKLGIKLRNSLYNAYNIEYFYTYVFIMTENGDIYLEAMFDNKKGDEVAWDKVWNYASRLKAKQVQYYYFEGFDNLEADDFPLYVVDMSKKRVLLTGI